MSYWMVEAWEYAEARWPCQPTRQRGRRLYSLCVGCFTEVALLHGLQLKACTMPLESMHAVCVCVRALLGGLAMTSGSACCLFPKVCWRLQADEWAGL